jgi:acetyltransferase
MSVYRLDRLFAPRSVAVVGASPHAKSVGRTVVANLRGDGFAGTIHVVNPEYGEIEGIATSASIDALPAPPDVVVIATPPPSVPEIVAAAGAKGAAASIIITAGLGHGKDSLAEAAEAAARSHGMRLIGPNCLGVMVPAAKFNASFALHPPGRGDLALVSQSGAIAAGMVEWASRRGIGFSGVVSVGDQVDVDIGDLLDFFAVDRSTRAILLYIEQVLHPRKFMSAARAAARTKPVIVVKSGRHKQGAKAAATHTGALAGSDSVYAAAFRRAGLLRVLDFDELFDAAETLGRLKPFSGQRLAILTNGGGIGVLAVDRLVDRGGVVAELAPETLAKLDAALPPIWSRGNPVDIIGDADGERYARSLETLLGDAQNDAVLVMNVPTALGSTVETAGAVAEVVKTQRTNVARPKPVFAVWVGDDGAASDIFKAAEIPHFATEADAIGGFMHLVRYAQAREALMRTPPDLPQDFSPDFEAAKRIVDAAVADGRGWLDPVEVADLFAAYAIPIVPTRLARNAEEAAAAARPFLAEGGRVVVKILSRDIVHKSDVGGVRLDLVSVEAVREAAQSVIARAKAALPQARIAGVTVQPMIARPQAQELIAGIADDPTFGPVIAFGQGGTAVEVVNDKALALPPLDLQQAQDLIGRTRVARMLAGYRDVPAAKREDIALTLVKLAQLVADLPQIRELDINPLLADADGVISLDARVSVSAVERRGRWHPRFVIRPYPKEWERHLVTNDGLGVFVRPVRPEDEDMFRAFFTHVSNEDLRLRFFAPVKDFSHVFVARLTQIDYARAMAFVAIDEESGEMLGAVRLHADANYEKAEYGILVRSDLKGRGLGWLLMQNMIEYARSEGLHVIEGQVLRENTTMLAMCRELGFSVAADPNDSLLCDVKLAIKPT